MFIDKINDQNIYTNINFLDPSKQKIQEYNNFINFFEQALGEINNIQNNTQKNTEKFELHPSSTSLNDIMINLQKSSISIELAIQIRNKIISAYKEIMSQQV